MIAIGMIQPAASRQKFVSTTPLTLTP